MPSWANGSSIGLAMKSLELDQKINSGLDVGTEVVWTLWDALEWEREIYRHTHTWIALRQSKSPARHE